MTALHSKSSGLLGVFGVALGLALFVGCGDDGEGGGSDNPNPDGGAGTAGSDAGLGGSAGSAGAAGSAGSAGTGGTGGAPHGQGWDESYALPGVQGETAKSTVHAVAITPGRKLFVGGSFTHAGSVPAANIAVWNGEKWSASGNGLPGMMVHALAETPDEKMYALAKDDSSWESSLHFWDGNAWIEVPAATDGDIAAIDVSENGTLYAAGTFTTIGGVAATNVARRVNGTWEALGAGGPTDWIEAVNVVGGSVCVGGGADLAQFGVACFDGTQWTSRKGNIEIGTVHTLTSDAGGTLYAGGNFMLTGESGGGGLAKWTGTKWELVGGGLLGEFGQPEVYSVKVDGAKVYAAGYFAFAGGLFVRHIAMWDGKKWNDMNGGLLKLMGVDLIEQPRGRTLALDDGGEIYVGGRLTFAGAVNALRIARWDGADWHAVDDPLAVRLGVNGGLNAIYAASDGSVYVGGTGFSYLGGNVAANDVARLDPVAGQWYPLGAGLNGALAFAEKDGSIYAVGNFVSSGNTSVKAIARWDGAAWQSVGGGLDGPGNSIVRGPDGKLYVGGSFETAGAKPARNVAVWDGTAWSALGSGVGAEFESVRVISFDQSGKLYAGGSFTKLGTEDAKNVAVWDGTKWSPLGEGLDDAVWSFTFYQGKLVAGGTFNKSGATDVPHVAQWNADTNTWTPVGGGIVADGLGIVYIQAMVAKDSDLYVAGIIEKAGDVKVSHIARFDGTTWHDVDQGVDDVVEDMVITSDSLWLGGVFTRAGNYGSIGIARYWFGP